MVTLKVAGMLVDSLRGLNSGFVIDKSVHDRRNSMQRNKKNAFILRLDRSCTNFLKFRHRLKQLIVKKAIHIFVCLTLVSFVGQLDITYSHAQICLHYDFNLLFFRRASPSLFKHEIFYFVQIRF